MASSVREDRKCGYCLQQFSDLDDPRELPCCHVVCLRCVKDDYSHTTRIKCPHCGQLHNFDPDSLKSCNEKVDDVKYYCFVCKDSSSEGYCVSCGQHNCEEHLENHTEAEHEIVDISTFTASPMTYLSVVCDKHNKEVSMCCDRCLWLACAKCETMERNCQSNSGVLPRDHHVMSLASMEKLATTSFDEKLTHASDMVVRIEQLEKEEMRKLDLIEGAAQFRGSNNQLTEEIHMNLCTLLSMKEYIQDVQKSVSVLLREAHITEVIKQMHEMSKKLSDACRDAFVLTSKMKGANERLAAVQKLKDYSTPLQRRPTPIQVAHVRGSTLHQPLTAAMLNAYSPTEQKQMLGDRLFPLVEQLCPGLGGKITGTLLELCNSELLNLLTSHNALVAKVGVLNQQIRQQGSSQHTIPSLDRQQMGGQRPIWHRPVATIAPTRPPTVAPTRPQQPSARTIKRRIQRERRRMSAWPDQQYVQTVSSASHNELQRPLATQLHNAQMPAREPLTAAMLAAAPPVEQKQMLGERIYPLIQSVMHDSLNKNNQPVLDVVGKSVGNSVGKITGMLLELDNAELLYLLDATDALKDKVDEAVLVLQDYFSTATDSRRQTA